MKTNPNVVLGSRTIMLRLFCLSLLVGLLAPFQNSAQAQRGRNRPSPYPEENNQIRRDKMDLILPKIMRNRGVDMWIHVARQAIRDPFGAEELGSTSGVFVFTDRGGDRIERAVLGRRWGGSQRAAIATDYEDPIAALGVYDIIASPVFVGEPVSDPMTEYDYRFKGLREFVEERNPKTIAVNFRSNLGTWETSPSTNTDDGISHTDYVLLTEELGKKFADRVVSSEYLIMDYVVSPVPSEVELLKKIREDELQQVRAAFDAVVPGETPTRGGGVTVFRRMSTGLSQRGRSAGWENAVIQGGDILAAPSQGMFAYVLREGESEPPSEIQELWQEYLTVGKIFAETIRAGRTSTEIMNDYKQRFAEAGINVIDPQLHMAKPKNNFPIFSDGFDPGKTLISIDLHGKTKGARSGKPDVYMGPRMGSYGPDWTHEIPLADNHHFVLEYFFYMPSPTSNPDEDQYLLWWDHEQAVATADGVKYLSPPQEELILID